MGKARYGTAPASSGVTLDSFLRGDDLELLRDSPLVGEKDPGFVTYLAALAGCGTVFSCGFTLCLSPSMFCCTQIAEGSYLNMNDEQVEFSQPSPSCCVLARTQRTVRFENVTDTTIEDDCCLQMFGLKKLVVQTAGTGGATPESRLNGVQAVFLKEPDAWKAAINHAVKLSKNLSAPGAQGMGRDAVPKAAKLQKAKLDNIAELARQRVVTESQADRLRIGALMSSEEDFTLQLLAMSQLVQQGHLSPAHLESAVEHVLKTTRA